MSRPAIVVENLSKEYRLGRREAGYRTFREAVSDAVSAPVRKLRRRASGSAPSDDTGEVFRALDGVSFEVQPGEVVGIIGRNGAGKSTLLKVLSRITEPTSGRVRVRGRVASLLEVGTGFHPELSGRENVFLNGAILGMSRREIERKFDEIVAFAEVERFIDTPVKRYSSGMYLRLAFAVAAHLEPEILLVDEVLAVGDAAFQRKSMGKMGDVARAGRTVLFVSHNMAAVHNLCSKCVWLHDGASYGPDRTDQVIAQYLKAQGEEEQHRFKADGPPLSPAIRLDAARLLFDGAGEQVLHNGAELTFQAHVVVTEPLPYSMCLAVHREGELVMYANAYHNVEQFNLRSPGSYLLQFRIPRHLLNPGQHKLGFFVSDCTGARENFIRQEELITFNLLDDGARRGNVYSGTWGGAVSPILDATALKCAEPPGWADTAG